MPNDDVPEGLLSCPNMWCTSHRVGQEAVQPRMFRPFDLQGGWCVRCPACFREGARCSTEAEAIVAWNTRASPAPQPAMVEGWPDVVEALNHTDIREAVRRLSMVAQSTREIVLSQPAHLHAQCFAGLLLACDQMMDALDAPAPPQPAIRVPLFQAGDFTLASGASSRWKIECDALTPQDWQALAVIAAEILPPFGRVEGVPSGGWVFAAALAKHVTAGCATLLIAEDVVTTGGSMERHRAGREAIGVAVFARGPSPTWVTPLFPAIRVPTREEVAERLWRVDAERIGKLRLVSWEECDPYSAVAFRSYADAILALLSNDRAETDHVG